jgi:hypothetical protein
VKVSAAAFDGALDVEQSVVIEASESIFNKLKVSDSKSAIEIAVKFELVKLEL